MGVGDPKWSKFFSKEEEEDTLPTRVQVQVEEAGYIIILHHLCIQFSSFGDDHSRPLTVLGEDGDLRGGALFVTTQYLYLKGTFHLLSVCSPHPFHFAVFCLDFITSLKSERASIIAK